ncbi:MAG: nucleotidyltransferase [Bryobacterales bacterium]|nr:nucleotidyltransferase [Bryobacterales bacterium]
MSDFKELLSEFNAHNVEFLIVGAHALAVHGVVRATKDLDIWVRPSSKNARKVLAALQSFGAPLYDLTIDDLATPGLIFQIGIEPVRIDILTLVDGLVFEAAWSCKSQVSFEGEPVNVLSREDLIRNKRAAGRPRDLADISQLLEGE